MATWSCSKCAQLSNRPNDCDNCGARGSSRRLHDGPPVLRHYHALRDAARAKGWPVAFKTDLTKHDLAFCRRYDASQPFLWVLRDAGTHVVTPDTTDGVGHRCYAYPRFIAEAFGEAGGFFYWWNGVTLRELRGVDEATELLSDEYERRRACQATTAA
jgi:hypothetical protein